jgi:phosphate transport system protein
MPDLAVPEPILHIHRTPLQQGLAEAERGTLSELELVREALRLAIQAAASADAAIADEVLTHGERIESWYAEVHERLMNVIARQSPVAGDLRLALALLHVNDKVERMGAQCVNIATLRTAMRSGVRPSGEQLRCIRSMAELADEQIAAAASAFSTRDVDAAVALREHDVEINERNRQCFGLGDADTEASRETAFFLALMARAIERIGDNAVDIGRQAIFVATGQLRA